VVKKGNSTGGTVFFAIVYLYERRGYTMFRVSLAMSSGLNVFGFYSSSITHCAGKVCSVFVFSFSYVFHLSLRIT
jgi:hypothetical protein